MASVVGLVLAAGAGSRYGAPKALARTPSGTPWLSLAVDVLEASGCAGVTVVLGAAAAHARALVPASASVVIASRWAEGMGASLAEGFRALPRAGAALVTLVDLPGLPATACARVVGSGGNRDVLRRAVYRGRPGHPVLIGANHWAPVTDSLSGDRGGRAYLDAHGVEPVECADLFSGTDVDRP